jgi:hypothetical protein
MAPILTVTSHRYPADMPAGTAPSAAPPGLPKPVRRLLAVAIVMGFALSGLAGALPEPHQHKPLWLSIALLSACSIVLGAYLAKWTGLWPVVGMLLGALSFLTPVGWRYVENRQQPEASLMTTIAVPTAVPARPLPRPKAAPPLVSRSPVPTPGSFPSAQSAGATGPLDRVLTRPNAEPLPQSGDEEPVEPVAEAGDPADYNYRPWVTPGTMSRRARLEAAPQR